LEVLASASHTLSVIFLTDRRYLSLIQKPSGVTLNNIVGLSSNCPMVESQSGVREFGRCFSIPLINMVGRTSSPASAKKDLKVRATTSDNSLA
jgi:hypothetical protein